MPDYPASVRFQGWYSTYAGMFTSISEGVCNETLSNYLNSLGGSSSRSDYFRDDTCDLHVDCLLSNTRESVKSTVASAAIFLSLVPTIMSMLGPSLTQLAILSTRRPLLSFLISVGSSEFYLDSLFRVESPQELFSIANGEQLFPRLKGPKAILMSVFEYTLAGAAVANVIHNSWRLGTHTVLGFLCNTYYFPLVWTLMLPGIFLCVAVPFQFSAIAKYIRAHGRSSTQDLPETDSLELPPVPHHELPRTGSGMSAKRFVAREVLPSLHHPSIPSEGLPNFERWLTILLNAASFIAAIHVLVGICFFSSINFISVTDAIEVTVRYLASAAACRLVVMLEFTGMKERLNTDERKGIAESRPYSRAT